MRHIIPQCRVYWATELRTGGMRHAFLRAYGVVYACVRCRSACAYRCHRCATPCNGSCKAQAMACAAKRKRDTRRTARAGEAHQPRGRRSRKRRDRADGRGGEAQGTREVFRPVPCARIGARMRGLTPREGSLAERGGADVPPTRLVQPREMPGSKADGARMAVQPRKTRRRRQSLDCRAWRGQGGCAARRGPQRRPAFPADSQAREEGEGVESLEFRVRGTSPTRAMRG